MHQLTGLGKQLRPATIVAGILVLVASSAEVATAASTTTSLGSRITIQSSCIVTKPTDMNFGTRGLLGSNFDATTTLSVRCTNTTPYSIGLGVGTGAGATVASRKMTAPSSNTVNYTIYSNSGRTTVWGNTVGTNTVARTGTGAAQSVTLYGRVPAQTTPLAGSYADTVTITVTY